MLQIMNYFKTIVTTSYNMMLGIEEITEEGYVPVDKFKFHEPFEDETNNGLYFCDRYIPEEIVILILSYIPPEKLLKTTLVCRKWCNLIKSTRFWSIVYSRHYSKKAKKLPWFVYYSLFATRNFNNNLLLNGNGQLQFNHWVIISNYGDEFQIEDPPVGADALPSMIDDFNGYTSCFATSYYECNKLQMISFTNKRLLQFILNKYRPHIYISEYMCGRFDCGCVYKLECQLLAQDKCRNNNVRVVLDEQVKKVEIEQWQGSKWQKVEMVMKDYPKGVIQIIFQHEGRDTQYWKGHYGSKMAGGVVKILFDSIGE